MKNVLILFFLFALFAPSYLSAQPLEEELKGLLDTHPQILAARKTLGAAEEATNKAFSGYYPVATLSGDSGVERSNTPTRRNAGQDVYTRGRETYKFNIKENLFDGGEIAGKYAVANAQRDIAVLSLEATRQTALQEGILAYLNVLRQTRLVELAKGTEINIKRQLNLEDERVKRGSGIAVDVLQAKSRLQLAKEKRVSFEGALADAETRYRQVFGHSPEVPNMSLPLPPMIALPEKVEDAIEVAKKENPSVLSSGKQVLVDQEKRDVARAGFMPSVNLVIENNYTSDVDTVIGVKRDTQILVKASWELFNGFGTSAGVAQAALEYGASQDKSIQSLRKATEATQLAWQALQTARKRMALLENAMNIAAEVFDARRKLREAGKENVINVLDAENELSNARINFTGASFDARQATYQLLAAMGRLMLDKAVVASDGTEVALPIPVKDVDEGTATALTVPLPGDIAPTDTVPSPPPGAMPEGANPFDSPFQPDESSVQLSPAPAPAPTTSLDPSPFDQPPVPKASPRIPVSTSPIAPDAKPAEAKSAPEVMPPTEEPFDALPTLKDKPRKAEPAQPKQTPSKPVAAPTKPPARSSDAMLAPTPAPVPTPTPAPAPVKRDPGPAPAKPPSGGFGGVSDNPFDMPFVPQ